MDEVPWIANHIIIIGKSLSNLYDLVKPLRSRELDQLAPIVIVYPDDFPVVVWERINIFQHIYLIRGSVLEEADLKRSGIFRANQVVILANSTPVERSAGSDALVDAEAIFCYQSVRRLNEQANVIVEIIRQSNAMYLNPESGLNSQNIHYKFTPEYASGALFTSNVLDTLISQVFYDRKIIDIINKLIGVSYDEIFEKKQSSKLQESFKVTGSSLQQIAIPEECHGQSYGFLFHFLIRKRQVPLGILRGIDSDTKLGSKGNLMLYIYTNRPPDTSLFSRDKMFLLAQKSLIGPHHQRGSKDFHESPLHHSVAKQSDAMIEEVEHLKSNINNLQQTQDNLNATIANTQLELNEKVSELLEIIRRNNLNTHHTFNGSNGPLTPKK